MLLRQASMLPYCLLPCCLLRSRQLRSTLALTAFLSCLVSTTWRSSSRILFSPFLPFVAFDPNVVLRKILTSTEDTSFSTVSLNLLKTTAVPQVLLDYLAFVGGLIPSNTANKELITSRTRALSLRGSIQPTDRQVQLVPYETYEQYKDLGMRG